MKKIDYQIFYKKNISEIIDWQSKYSWDVFISSYTKTQRVKENFDQVRAKEKHWIVFPEFEYLDKDIPPGAFIFSKKLEEAEFIIEFWNTKIKDAKNKHILIDVTGFVRPYLAFLIKFLYLEGITTFEVLYCEPSHYIDRSKTKFSDEIVTDVRPIKSFESPPKIEIQPKDLIIINSGYDHQQIIEAAKYKENARKIQLFGYPPLSADMYQENISRVANAEEAVGGHTEDRVDKIFAPAYDPFITASVIRSAVDNFQAKEGPISNLYLCPIATKAQLLGMVLYYLWEWEKQSDNITSIIYPFCETYPQKTSLGISRIWKYTIELPS